MLKNKNYNTIFNIWLITLQFLIVMIIVVGGLTRLTDSGLSITQWELFTGLLPPTTNDSWVTYFNLYKKIPQYSILNNNMTLDEFKIIFLWEYAHRLIARFIGIFFLIPFLIFIFINYLKKYLIRRLTIIFIMILLQGFIGWYMVKSGLVQNISVSHYRLSVHLFIAFSIFSSIFWISLNSLNETKKKFFQFNKGNFFLKFLLFLLFIQIILGAFVSGLDAGKIYQTWPLMNGGYFPDDILFNNYLNFNKPSFVQFIHRNIAYVIFFLSIYVGFSIFKKKQTFLYNNFLFYFLIILVQIMLGILVLVSGVNIYLASMHQISSIFLIASAINLYYRSIRS
jgi:heme a synthase